MNNKEILKKLESDYADIVECVFPEAGNGWWIHINVDKIEYYTYDEGCYTIHEDTLREAYAVLKRVIKRVEAKKEKMKKELKEELKEELTSVEIWDPATNSWQYYDYPQGETVASYAEWCIGTYSEYWATVNEPGYKIRLNGWYVIDGADYFNN